jgi:hypothetical protein
MRYALLALILLIAPVGAAPGDTLTDPYEKLKEEQRLEDELATMKDLAKRLEEQAGYSNVEILPTVLVAVANNKAGKRVTILIDAESMVAIELGQPGNQTASHAPANKSKDKPPR